MTPTTNLAKTDEDIKTSVVEELRWDTRVDASKVEVRVEDGVVTLTGTVPSYGTRVAAAADAWAVLGVVRVDNHLTVALPAAPPVPSDDALRDNAHRTLDWNPDVDAANVRVSVANGTVTLSGHWHKYDDVFLWRT